MIYIYIYIYTYIYIYGAVRGTGEDENTKRELDNFEI